MLLVNQVWQVNKQAVDAQYELRSLRQHRCSLSICYHYAENKL